MAREFHDINSPGYSFGKKKEEPKKKRNTGIDDSEPVEKKKEEPEVRIISAEWKPGPKGFQYLEQCFLDVQTEFLPDKEKTIRLRIRGKLFGSFNGQEFDLSQEVEGFIDRKTGIARIEIKKLWFIDDHYPEWQKDHQTPCTYKIKGIFHSLGENQIDSPELGMPNEESTRFVRMILQDSLGGAVADMSGILEISTGEIIDIHTDSQGFFETSIPSEITSATLKIEDVDFDLSFVKAIKDIAKSDIQSKLSLLGLYKGRLDGDFKGITRNALIKFQYQESLSPSGKLDDETANCLKSKFNLLSNFPQDELFKIQIDENGDSAGNEIEHFEKTELEILEEE